VSIHLLSRERYTPTTLLLRYLATALLSALLLTTTGIAMAVEPYKRIEQRTIKPSILSRMAKSGALKVTAPPSGTCVTFGDALPIRWASLGTTSPVRIELWNSYQQRSYFTITSSTPNDGEYLWRPMIGPGELPPMGKGEFPIRITTTDGKLHAESARLTLTKPIHFNNPQDGFHYKTGTTVNIDWTTACPLTAQYDSNIRFKVQLHDWYTKQPVHTIVSDIDPKAASSSYSWVIPANFPANSYYISIGSHDGSLRQMIRFLLHPGP